MEPTPKPIELSDHYIQSTIQRLNFQISPDSARERGWYGEGRRSYVVAGEYQGQAAELKIIADPREIDSGAAQQTFSQALDGSPLLAAPALYYHEPVAPGVTVLVMERLPVEVESLHSPLSPAERQTFLAGPFAELMRHKAQLAYRAPTELERQPVPEFVQQRFNSWRQLAEQRVQQQQLRSQWLEELPAFEAKVMEQIRASHGDSSLEWTYGLPKPDKFHRVGDRYYLTDFKLVAMRPAGYDVAIAAWADGLMPVLENTTLDEAIAVQQARGQMQAWLTDWEQVATQQGLSVDAAQLQAMLAERIMGTIYADTIANRNLDANQIERRLAILKSLLQN